MIIKHAVACSVMIAALASTPGAWAQNRPAAPVAPAAITNAAAAGVAEPADRQQRLLRSGREPGVIAEGVATAGIPAGELM